MVVLPLGALQPHTSGSKSMWLCCPLLDKRTAGDIIPNGCSSCLFLPVPACSLFSPYSSNTPVPLDSAVTLSVFNPPYPTDTWCLRSNGNSNRFPGEVYPPLPGPAAAARLSISTAFGTQRLLLAPDVYPGNRPENHCSRFYTNARAIRAFPRLP